MVAAVLDAQGAPGAFQPLSTKGMADSDVDAVATPKGALVVWNDHSELDTRVRLAVLDPSGQVTATRGAVPSAGEQGFIGLTAGNSTNEAALLAWDDLATVESKERLIQLTTLDQAGSRAVVGATLSFAHHDGSLPTFTGARQGFVAITSITSCLQDATKCSPDGVPTVVRWGAGFHPVSSAPLLLTPLAGAAPDSCSTPVCSEDSCLTLASKLDTSAHFLATPLPLQGSAWTPPLEVSTGKSPQVKDAHAVLGGASFLMQTSTTVGPLLVVASLTDGKNAFVPIDTPDALRKPTLAVMPPKGRTSKPGTLTLQLLDPTSGKPTRDPVILSNRAQPTGGLALASDAEGTSVAIAWAGIVHGVSQLFVTRWALDGKHSTEFQLTHRKQGDIGDVNLVRVDDGWAVAWIDSEGSTSEPHLLRLDHLLHMKPETRMGPTGQGANRCTLLAREHDGLLVWSRAATDAPTESELFVSRWARDTGAKQGEPQRVVRTPDAIRAVQLAPGAATTPLFWLAQPSDGKPEHPLRIDVGWWDGSGAMPMLPHPLAGTEGSNGFAVEASAGGYHLVTSRPRGPLLELRGGAWSGQGGVELQPLLPVFAGSQADLTLSLATGTVTWMDTTQASDQREGRIRWLRLGW